MTNGSRKPRAAFLGLGLMGESMAVNLAKSGMEVVAWNRTPGKRGSLAVIEAGARCEKELKDAVKDADLIFTCLGDIQDVEEVIIGADGVQKWASKRSVVVDFSTIGPQSAKRIYENLKEKEIHFLDAPVTGGDVGARNGTLTIMVGGDEKAFLKAKPALEKMGNNIQHCGPAGAGQALKLCNQILCAVNMVSVCESFSLARTLGVNPALIVDVLSSGAGGSWALSTLGPRILKSDFEPGFALKHMLKDLRLVFENLEGSEDDLPGTKLARDLFRQISERDGGAGGAKGTQAMSLAYEEKPE